MIRVRFKLDTKIQDAFGGVLSALAEVEKPTRMRRDPSETFVPLEPEHALSGESIYLAWRSDELALHPYTSDTVDGILILENEDLPAVRDLLFALAREFGSTLVSGTADVNDAEFGASPSPPLAERDLVLVTTETAILSHYPTVETFLAAWRRAQRHGATWVCERVPEDGDLAAAVFEGQWHLCRNAPSEQSRYPARFSPRTAGEHLAAEAQPDVLTWHGYREADATHVFSASVFADSTGRHVSAKQVLTLGRWRRRRRDDDGRRVEQVHILFPDRIAAMRERRPLLDLGLQVLFLDEKGNYCPAGRE